MLLQVFTAAWTFAFLLAAIFQFRLDFWLLWGSARDQMEHSPWTTYLDLLLCIVDVATYLLVACSPRSTIFNVQITRKQHHELYGKFLLASM